MPSVVASVKSWVFATSDFVLAFVGAAAVVYPTLSLLADAAGPPFQSFVPFVAFSLAFGATYPLVAGGWSIARLYDVLVVALCFLILATVLLAAIAGTTGRFPGGTHPSAANAGWVVSLALAYALVSRLDVRLFG